MYADRCVEPVGLRSCSWRARWLTVTLIAGWTGIRTSEQKPVRAARGPPARGSSLLRTHAHAAGPSRPTVTEIRELVLGPCRIGCTRSSRAIVQVSRIGSRRIIGWQTADHPRTDLPLDALEMALWDHNVHDGQTIRHSDWHWTPCRNHASLQ